MLLVLLHQSVYCVGRRQNVLHPPTQLAVWSSIKALFFMLHIRVFPVETRMNDNGLFLAWSGDCFLYKMLEMVITHEKKSSRNFLCVLLPAANHSEDETLCCVSTVTTDNTGDTGWSHMVRDTFVIFFHSHQVLHILSVLITLESCPRKETR